MNMPFNRPLQWALLALALNTSSAWAAISEDAARQALVELHALVTEGTGVVNDLQPLINSGKVPKEQVTPDALMDKLKGRYRQVGRGEVDGAATGLQAEVRAAYLAAYKDVLQRSQGALTRGGQDAFVPAFFRAQVLKEFNQVMKGKVQAYATNRDGELINSDWAVHRVMKGSPLAAEVQRAMGSGSMNAFVRKSGERMLGYWPMKLGAGCVACHAQNGLKQTEGGFGGVLVAEVPLQ